MDAKDLAAAMDDPLPHLASVDPVIRRLAVSLCSGRVDDSAIRTAVVARLSDDDGSVRAAAAEVLGEASHEAFAALMSATPDSDSRVVEAVATALGEVGDPRALPWLIATSRDHEERIVREAAVAALGAIGDDDAVPVLLEVLTSGPPQVRRRAAVALTVFDDPRIEPALRAARHDRNPMVREVVEMIIGRQPDTGWDPLRLEPAPTRNPDDEEPGE